ncbi:MAG TPA: LysR substrate-binding domain-containing protein [Burkholderiales bacterium]|nr:LysR substrate-binding domain-containing protein [Burkholderiales bacterium]
MRFDLTDLRLFVHIAEAGSITGGAARAHLALASASARLQGMEESIGAALFIRGRRGVQPTSAGRALLQHARLIAAQVERMVAELGEHARGVRGQVRLLCNTSALAEFLPQALSAFMALHPQVDVDVEEGTSQEIVRALLAGNGEIGIVNDSVDFGSLESFPFRADRLVLVAPRGHPLSKRRKVGFAQVLDHDFIGFTKGVALQEYLSGHAARLGRRIKVRVRLRSFEAVAGMVERGLGVAVMPESAALRCRQTMQICRIALSEPWSVRQLTLCMRSFTDLPPYARQLVEHLRA